MAIGTILTLSYGILLYYTSTLQKHLVFTQAKEEARMLHRQIILTRQWVADHHGLFVIETDQDGPNPFLENPVVKGANGKIYVKRNPAMVTRELSEYAQKAGFCWFRVTSLNPVNPANMPDDFERHSLRLFEQGVPEVVQLTNGRHGRYLRYVAPLKVKTSCLPCHARHGYTLGDIRGALSISIPMSWSDSTITRNNRSILLFGVLSVLAVALVLYHLFNTLVVKPLNQLSKAMDALPDKDVNTQDLPLGHDEIGQLSSKFLQLCQRLNQSQQELDKAREQGFRNEKLAALGQLTAGIAHEINNPLGGMLNCIKTIRKEPENPQLHRRYLGLLEKGLHRIEHIMHQLLNFGRTGPLKLEKYGLDAIIRECFELLDYQLKNINLHLDLNLQNRHCLDIEAIQQIIINISLNAIQAMPDGGTLSVATWEEQETIYLRFTDSGSGIAPDILPRIFDPFFTTKDVGKGTGLGLAVTHSLIQRMGGSIEVQSTVGRGTTFILSIPVERECHCPEAQTQMPAVLNSPTS